MSKINKLGNEIKTMQKREKKREVENQCQRLNKESNPKQFFELFGKMASPVLNEGTTTLPRPLEDELGNRASTSQDKAFLFANRLQRVHQEPNFAGFDSRWKKTVEDFIAQNEKIYKVDENETYQQEEEGDESVLCKKVSLEEFEANLAKCKNRSAVGQDGISYFLLKKLRIKSLFKILYY